jgi:hypothetical protein
MTWPLAARAGSVVQDPGDPLFEIWVMRSVQHRLIHDPANLYDANAFYPFTDVLAFSEEAISTAVLAWPIYLVSGNDVLAYNAMVLLSFWLVAFAVFLLSRELGASPGAAFVAGLAAAFAPARYGQMSHLHMLTIGWLPLAMWALTIFIRRGGRHYVVLSGVALAIQLLASLHLAVFATLALGWYLAALAIFDRRARQWGRHETTALVCSLVLPFLLFAPTLLPRFEVQGRFGFERGRSEIERLSASPAHYLMVHPWNHVWAGRLDADTEAFFPGLVVITGALLAIGWWRRWPVVYAAALTCVAAVISFGFAIEIAGRSVPMPYAVVYDLAPAIRGIRGVGRFGLLTAIGLPLLAGFGYSWLWQRVRPRLGSHAFVAGLSLTTALTLCVCFELRTAVGADRVPNDKRSVAVYAWLADQPNGPVIEFPVDGLLVHGVPPPDGMFQPIRYMYHSTRHWNPSFAGYSGFIPSGHIELVRAFADDGDAPSMMTAQNVALLQDLGIRWAIVHHTQGYDWQRVVATADALPQLRRVAEVGDSTVFEVLPATVERPVRDGGRFSLPGEVAPGGLYPALVLFQNPADSAVLGWLNRRERVLVEWRDQAGTLVRSETTTLPFPAVLDPGDTYRGAEVTAPLAEGLYTVRATFENGSLPPAEQLVWVH